MINISEIFCSAPEESRGDLENRTYKTLEELKIPFERVDNDSVESMEECVEISNKLGAEIRKSIFVRDQKKINYYLVVMPAGKSFNTKSFCEKLGCSKVSFASPESMKERLGVLSGTASIMSLLNDEKKSVKVVIDKEVANSEWFACNPGANTTHIKIKTEQLLNVFLPHIGHRTIIIEL